MISVLDPIPAHAFPVVARSPGKCVLFGEHSVVHGEPEILIAIDMYTQVSVKAAPELSLNADRDPRAHHPYLGPALDRFGPMPPNLEIRSVSRIPRSAGLGSSAAFVAALCADLVAARGGISRSALAAESFGVERGAQGVGSPGDTSAVVAGGVLSLNAEAGTPLWEVSDGARQWTVRRLPNPGWAWVVGYSGVPRSTADAVRAVGRRLSEADGADLLRQFGDVARAGEKALVAEDRDQVGREMLRNQELLRTVGVSHPRVEQMLTAIAPACVGAKVTGAGAGGSLLALPKPERELEVVRLLTRIGAVAFSVRVAERGTELVGLPKGPEGP